MLQKASPEYASEFDRPAPDLKTLHDILSDFLAFTRRQFPVMALIFFSCLALTIAYLATASKKYVSTAQLVIDTRKTQMLQQQSGFGGETPLDSPTVDSQVEILKSESFALAVIKDMHLTEDPEFVGNPG